MFNAFCLIPMFRMLFIYPFLWVVVFQRNRKLIVWAVKRLQYENYCVAWWDGGGPSVKWKQFKKSKTRHYVLHFYEVEVPKIMAQRYFGSSNEE